MTNISETKSSGKPTDVLVNFVLDKSGSMGPLAASTIEGFNAFLDEQRAGTGKALLSLTLFDTGFDVRYVAVDLREVPPLGTRGNRYQPAGGTALLDAVATTIKGADAWLAGHRDEFSGDVICVTDRRGGEQLHHHDPGRGQRADQCEDGRELGVRLPRHRHRGLDRRTEVQRDPAGRPVRRRRRLALTPGGVRLGQPWDDEQASPRRPVRRQPAGRRASGGATEQRPMSLPTDTNGSVPTE